MSLSPKYTMLLPGRFGWFCGLTCDPFQTGAILSQGEWAPNETALLLGLVHRGDTVLDLGANVGNLSLAFAAATGPTGRVLAFEPQRFPYYCLCANIALNSLIHFVQAERWAIGEEPGSIPVPILDPTSMVNFGGVSLADPALHTRPTEEVPVVTIDSLNLPNCHLIKADVEGMEPAALRGARATITQFRPIIWAEQLEAQVNSRPELQKIFADHDYRAWKICTDLYAPQNIRLEPHNMFKLPDGQNMTDHNILALPREIPPPPWIESPAVEIFHE